jgi:hypothetical protein
VIGLSDALHAELVGVKAATLGGLPRAGFAVSDGFVVSTAAFAAAASAGAMTLGVREAVHGEFKNADEISDSPCTPAPLTTKARAKCFGRRLCSSRSFSLRLWGVS